MYEGCPNFVEIVVALSEGPSREFNDYMLEDGYMFRGNHLCISRTSVRDFLEKIRQLMQWGLNFIGLVLNKMLLR